MMLTNNHPANFIPEPIDKATLILNFVIELPNVICCKNHKLLIVSAKYVQTICKILARIDKTLLHS